MNPNTMTLDEARDWLAREDGWVFTCSETRVYAHWQRKGHPCLDVEGYDDHPYPPTLDGAAGAMPEGWSVRVYVNAQGVCIAHAKQEKPDSVYRRETVGDTEIIARYMLAVAVRMALASACREGK